MSCSIREVLLNSQANFENVERMNPMLKNHPLYMIAKRQLDNVIKAIVIDNKKLDNIWEAD